MNNNKIWETPEEIGDAVMQDYSVTDKEKIRSQYMEQVAQYPLYQGWFDRIDVSITKPTIVAEYGSGPGVLAGKLKNNKNVIEYTAIEPGETFREMTEEQYPGAFVIDGTAETYLPPQREAFDMVIATATYHHFNDKLQALKNIYRNLYPGGMLIIADGFLPNYRFDDYYNPIDKREFVNAVMKYVAAQIKFMPNPKEADIEDQMRTAILDTLRIEELKVCISIIKHQLEITGFKDVSIELLKRDDDEVNYTNLGWYFITAKKF